MNKHSHKKTEKDIAKESKEEQTGISEERRKQIEDRKNELEKRLTTVAEENKAIAKKLKKESENNKKEEAIIEKILSKKNLQIIAISVVSILVLLILIFSIQVKTKIVLENTIQNVTIYKTGYTPINISNYLLGNKNYPMNFSDRVYLSQEAIKTSNISSSIYKYVKDDYGNKISVVMGLNAALRFDSLFPKVGTTNNTYLVNGTIKIVNNKPVLDVISITQIDRILTETSYIEEKNTQVNRTVKSGIRINLSKGIHTVLGI